MGDPGIGRTYAERGWRTRDLEVRRGDSGMKSTEAILTSDYPFRGTVWPQFSKKRHPDSGNRPFHPPIGSLAPFTCPEMTTFGNDAGQDIGTDGAGGRLLKGA